MEGAAALLGPWFCEAWADDGRGPRDRVPSRAQRDAFLPEQRLRRAALGALTPPSREPRNQHWATYDPVPLPDPEAALELLGEPWRWPDIGCAGGRFTALYSRGLLGQTFEIEVVAEPAPRSPIFTRGYVTARRSGFAAARAARSSPSSSPTWRIVTPRGPSRAPARSCRQARIRSRS